MNPTWEESEAVPTFAESEPVPTWEDSGPYKPGAYKGESSIPEGPYVPGSYKGAPVRDSNTVELLNDTLSPVTDAAFQRAKNRSEMENPNRMGVGQMIAKVGESVGELLLDHESETATKSVVGISPQVVPTGTELEAKGVPPLVATPASAIVKAGAGLAQFITSPQGVSQMIVKASPAGVLQAAKWIYDMTKGSAELSGDLSVKLEKFYANPDEVTPEDIQAIDEDAANIAMLLYGAGKLTSHETSVITGLPEPVIGSSKSRAGQYASRLLSKQVLEAELPRPPYRIPSLPPAIREGVKDQSTGETLLNQLEVEKQATVQALKENNAPLTATALEAKPIELPAVEKPVEVKETVVESKPAVEAAKVEETPTETIAVETETLPLDSETIPPSASGIDVPIGARKAMTADLRDAVGLGILPDNAGYTLPDIWNEVTQVRTANPLEPAQLAQSVIANPRMLEPVEVGLLTARLVELKQSMNSLAANGDFQGVGNVLKEMDALTGAMKISGGKASKGLNAFRLISKDDFSLDTMMMRERSSKMRELTDAEMQDVASIAKEIEVKQAELDKESAIAEEQSQVEAAERAVAEMAGQLRGARQTKFKGFDQGTRGADVLDKLEGITNTIDPKLIKEHNPNWKPHKDLKKLFREGGMKADEAISGLGLDVKAGELGEILNAAARARRGNKTAARNEARLAKQEDRAAVLDSKIASVQAMIAAEKAKIFGKPVAITAGPTGVEAALSKIPNIISWIKIGAGHVNILRLKGQRGFDAWQAEMIATYPGNGLDSNLNAIYRASLKEARKQARELKSGVLDLSPAERRANTLKQAKETMAEEGFDKTVDLGRYAKQLAKQHISEGITKMGDVVEAVHADLLNIVPDFTRSETMDAISDYGKVRALDNNLVNKRARQLRTEIQMTRKLSDALAGEMPKKTGQQREPSTVLTRQLQKQLKDVMAEQGMNQKDPSKQLASALDAKKNAIRNRIAEIKDELASGKRLVRTNKGEIKLDAEGEVLQAELDGLKKQRETIFGKDEKKPLTDEQKLERATDAAEKELQKWTKRAMEAGLTGKEFTKTSKTTISSPEIKALKAQAEAAKAEYEELSGLKARLEGEKRASSLERERETIQKDIDRRLAGTESVGGKVNRPHDNPEIEGLLQVKDSVMERIAAEKKAEREAAKPSVEEMYVRRRLTALTRAEADYASRIARGDFESPRPKKAKPSLTEAQRNVVDDKAIEVERLKSEWRKRQAQNVLDNLKGGELFVDQMKEVSNLHRNLNSSFDWSAPRQASGALMSAIGDVPFAVVRAVTGRGALMDSPIANFARSMAKGYRATWSEQKFERYRKRYEARENYRNGLEEQAGLNRRGIETDENTRGRWSNSKLLKPILRPWNRAFETMLNENSAATFDAIVSTLADRSPESLKKVARLVNDLHGTGYVPGKFRAGVELASYVLWSPKLLIANIRNTLMAEAWGSGGPKEARKIARQYYAKMIMGAFAIQQLGKLAGYENDDKGRLLDGDTHIDPYGGHLQVINQEWMQLYDLLRYGPDEVGEATLDTLDIPEPKAPRMGDFEYFTYTKMHPSARLVYEMARKHGKNFDGSDKTVLGTVEDFLPMGGRPSDIMKLLEEHGIPKGIALQAAQMHGASVNIYQENERPKR